MKAETIKDKLKHELISLLDRTGTGYVKANNSPENDIYYSDISGIESIKIEYLMDPFSENRHSEVIIMLDGTTRHTQPKAIDVRGLHYRIYFSKGK